MSEPRVHPGEILREALQERQMSQREFATRMGLSTKHVNQIIQGHAGYSPKVALGMELVLGIKAVVWLTLQANHELAALREHSDG
jgi:HTH-type transcriptional regulator/antitoxin HigA